MKTVIRKEILKAIAESRDHHNENLLLAYAGLLSDIKIYGDSCALCQLRFLGLRSECKDCPIVEFDVICTDDLGKWWQIYCSTTKEEHIESLTNMVNFLDELYWKYKKKYKL